MTALRERLEAIVGKGMVLDSAAERIAHAHDASFYRLVPQAIALPQAEEQIAGIFALSRELGIPLTFRAAGTSLSGQAVSDGILVDITRGFGLVEPLDQGRRVRVQPAVIGGHVNRALAPYKTKFGPDPASIHTARIGGMLANNSSGMCCGVEQNAYRTLESMVFILPSGTRIDTAAPDADQQLRRKEPEIHEGLLDLKRRIEADAALAQRVRAKYRMKNTTGYSLNAFLDYQRPADILAHLLIGSEGTLAFIAEATLRTVPDLPCKLTGLLLFPDMHQACAAIRPLKDAGAKALELMDRASLRAVQDQPGMPPSFRALGPDAAALLAEFQSGAALDEAVPLAACAQLQLLEPARFTADPGEQAKLWRVRQGLFTSVGAARKSGTTVIIEDVAFSVDKLADAAVDLTRLFARHGYDEGIVFGHAKDGNLHFVITQSFNDAGTVARYARFIDDLVHLVVERYDGALKAEHGTGRNMAPFVEREWGEKAAGIMRELKRLVDPRGLLNPGVIVNDSKRSHLEHLKPMPTVEEEVDSCIECGFCEPRCPSRELTTTPRQRIVVRREMARLRGGGAPAGAQLAELESEFPYYVLDTCATDGLCAVACPVSIDTGKLTKRLRHEGHGAGAESVAAGAAHAFGLTEKAVRTALRAGNALGPSAMIPLTRAARALSLPLPLWQEQMPRAAPHLPRTEAGGAQAIYFPACISRSLGDEPRNGEQVSLPAALVELGRRAGVPLHIPADVEGVCCGVPFSSKGYAEGHRVALSRAVDRFWRWSGEGRLPIVIDASPCAYGVLHGGETLDAERLERLKRMRIHDPVEFAHDALLPRLPITRKAKSVAIHPVCSLVKMNLEPKFSALARACSERVQHPLDAGCCGFAGDRGFLVPELTASATRHEAAEVRAVSEHEGWYSSSRTCEIGMTRATGHPYRSILHLLEGATRAG